ncbi:MAG: hypothetical protein AAGA00_04985 [Pseudomonadota bacterium]
MFRLTHSTTINGLAVAGALAFAAVVSTPASAAPVPGAAFAQSGLEAPAGKVTNAHLRKRGFRSRGFRHRRFGHRHGFGSRGFGFGRHGFYGSRFHYRGHGLRRGYGYRGYGFRRGFGRGPVSGGR